MSEERCGFVAIIGAPNAGKSTLINQLVGSKISIATPKVQTTRFNVRGMCLHEKTQLIFIDTPGIFNAGKMFEKAMVQAAYGSISEADAVLLMVDARRGIDEETQAILDHLRQRKPKALHAAINKIDLVGKPKLMALAQTLAQQELFGEIFMVSALKGKGTNDISATLARAMPQSPWLFPADYASDMPLRMLAAEITREKLFMKLSQEIPYAILVETEKWDEKENSVAIAQIIYVQKEGQKKIILGEKGSMIKRVGMAARKELEAILEKKVHLNLFVKVRPGWKEERESYRLLGLDYKKN